MAKKRKHAKTDKRSVRRATARKEEKRIINAARKAGLLNAGFQPEKMNLTIIKALEGGHGYQPSLKKLTKSFNKQRKAEHISAKDFLIKQQKITDAYRKAEEIGKKNTARVQREKEFTKKYTEFREYYFRNQPKNPHGYKWFDNGEVPFYNPQTDAEIERDYANIKRMQKILNNPNEKEAKKDFYALRFKIITEAGGIKSFKGATIPAKKLTLRGITKNRDNTEYTAWLNYIAAAEANGCDIFADALREGGVGFSSWLYAIVGFDWRDFYAEGDVEVSTNIADKRIYEMAKGNQADPYWGSLCRKIMMRYAERYGWGKPREGNYPPDKKMPKSWFNGHLGVRAHENEGY